MAERVRVIILCEDRQQEVFARTFLEECGIGPIRVLPYPNGKGAGEKSVRENYPGEVRLFRSKHNSQPNTRLIVLTDADKLSVSKRMRILDQELQKAGQPVRKPDEPIGVFIPKRNIETWIYYLQGEKVNEDDVYRHIEHERECKTVARKLARRRNQPLDTDAPPSLTTACGELERIT